MITGGTGIGVSVRPPVVTPTIEVPVPPVLYFRRGGHPTKLKIGGQDMPHHGYRWNRMEAEKRFWAQVRMGPGCWEWTGRPNGNMGYGTIKVNGKAAPAHRYSWIINRGPIPPGFLVLHRCDRPLCVNPEHLFAGTQSDNVIDCVRKGRQCNARKTRCPRGHPYSKENTYICPSRPHRECRICIKAKNAKRKRKND